jgi:N-methylhydantoinase A
VPPGDITREAVEQMVDSFHEEYLERSGNKFEALPVQGVTYRVEARVPSSKVDYPMLPERDGTPLEAKRTLQINYLTDETIPAPEYDRTDLRAGDVVAGPAIIREPLSTTFMVPGQVAEVGRYGELRIRKA